MARHITPLLPTEERILHLLNHLVYLSGEVERLAPLGQAQREALSLCRDRLGHAREALCAYQQLRRVAELAPLRKPNVPAEE